MMLTLPLLLILLHTTSSATKPNNSCFPKNWKYAWSRVGNTWFTFLKSKGNWHEMEKQCRAIEPGRTMLASPRTRDENSHLWNIMKRDNEDTTWLGGVRMDGGKQFYWYRNNGRAITLEE